MTMGMMSPNRHGPAVAPDRYAGWYAVIPNEGEHGRSPAVASAAGAAGTPGERGREESRRRLRERDDGRTHERHVTRRNGANRRNRGSKRSSMTLDSPLWFAASWCSS